MTLESPQTYAEWYWRFNVDATKQVQSDFEEELAPSITQLLSALNVHDFLPPAFAPLLSSLQTPKAPAWGAIMGRFLSETADGIAGNVLDHALKDFNYSMAGWFGDLRIDKEVAAELWRRKKITEEMYDSRMKSAGFKEAEASAFYESTQPYPSLAEIIRWARYHGDPRNPQPTVMEHFNISAPDWPLWEWLTAQVLTTGQVQSLYRRGTFSIDDAQYVLTQLGWAEYDQSLVLDAAYDLPASMLLIQSGLMNEIRNDELLQSIARGGIHPEYAGDYLNAILTKPAAIDILRAMMRQDPYITDADRQLRRIGIHPDFIDVYKTLAYQIPPVGDIITMAVREAFSPEVAERFGQYEDYPKDLTTYAEKQGLSEEWSKRYWAAHWALPSPQQGFEMLHRGVITEDDLNLLLRASDVMPFWRDKLIQIAYSPLTRVDVRRMYGLGVLDEREVYEAYLELGYNEKNAERMAEFTVKQVIESQSGFNAQDVVSAYKDRLIDRGDAISLLQSIGLPYENAIGTIDRAEYTRLWDWTKDRISGIKNLYKKKVYDANQAAGELAGLNLPATEIETLMEQWYYEVKEEPSLNWTKAETMRFLKRGIIAESRALHELQELGYDEEHINVYIQDAKWTE